MKFKLMMKKNIKGERVRSMTNETYKKLCEDKLRKEIEGIKQAYDDSMSQAEKIYVR